MARTLIDLTGQRFSKLTVRGRVVDAAEDASPAARAQVRWRCECTCGRETTVYASNLKSGRTRSCGRCDAVFVTGVDQMALRVRIVVWSGPLSPSGKPYSFGEARSAVDDSLLFRTTPPVHREPTKGEQHACATRILTWLAGNGHIGIQAGRTFRRWVIEERIDISIRNCSTEADTWDRWYEQTGEARPAADVTGVDPARGRQVTVPVLTPDQREGLASLFVSWGDDDTAQQVRDGS